MLHTSHLSSAVEQISTPFMEKRGFLYKEGGKKKTWKLRYVTTHKGYFEYYRNATVSAVPRFPVLHTYMYTNIHLCVFVNEILLSDSTIVGT